MHEVLKLTSIEINPSLKRIRYEGYSSQYDNLVQGSITRTPKGKYTKLNQYINGKGWQPFLEVNKGVEELV